MFTLLLDFSNAILPLYNICDDHANNIRIRIYIYICTKVDDIINIVFVCDCRSS